MLALRGADGNRAELRDQRPGDRRRRPRRAGAERPVSGWWQALLLAFLGGAILNLMPCVFPILSLKLLGLAASVHRAEERRHGLAYAAGVVVSFAALGGLLLALRAGGAAVGWGFQLQSPVVVALLAYLMFAMGLSLSGVAEFGVGLGGIGGRFAERTGLAGAFSTGVLATVVATPCTAPFMGAALGFAMLAPPARRWRSLSRSAPGSPRRSCWRPRFPASRGCCRGPAPGCCGSSSCWRFRSMRTVAWLIWVLMQEIAPGDGFLRAARAGAGRLRGLDLRPHAVRRAGRAAARARRSPRRVRRRARRGGDAAAGGGARRFRRRGAPTASPTSRSAPRGSPRSSPSTSRSLSI